MLLPTPLKTDSAGVACHVEVRQLFEMEDFDGIVEPKTAERFRDIGMQ